MLNRSLQFQTKGFRLLFKVVLLLWWSLSSCVTKEPERLISVKKSTKTLEVTRNIFDTISTAAQALKAMQDGYTRYRNGRFEHIHFINVEIDSLRSTIAAALIDNKIKLLIVPGHAQCQAITKIMAKSSENKPASIVEKVLLTIP